jgi:hypothetical protein
MKFDMPGCEIRSRLTLTTPAHLTVTLAQKHQPPPPHPDGNTKNSGFESNAFVVYVDGVRQASNQDVATFTTAMLTDEQPHSYSLSTVTAAGGGAVVPAGTHDIRIVKATEADWNGGSPVPNYVTFYGINVTTAESKADDGGAMEGDGQFVVRVEQPPPLPTRKIEFLGDSITAGYCNECAIQKSDLPGGHNEAYGRSWDYQIGEQLNAQVHTAAWSGLGMVRNCCGGNTTMPAIFNRSLATDSSSVWDWSSWVADALVINLGTNDGGAATDPKYNYVGVYTELVMEASRHYGPDLQVFLACGPMSDGYCGSIQTVITNVVAKNVKAHFLDHRGFLNGTFGPACCGHPSIQVDTAMATYGSKVIKAALGW